jgi:hypothetical protein
MARTNRGGWKSVARSVCRSVCGALLALLAAPAPLLAQGPCFHARPAPACRVFLLTNAGGYLTPNRTNGGSHARVTVDWGVMVNANSRHAFGASGFVTLDEDEFTMGPAIHYRRWLRRDASVEVAIGTPVAGSELQPGSVLGLIKYSPEHWVGFALRPEYVRRRTFTCGPSCTQHIATSGRVYAGIEVGWIPGLALSLTGAAVLGFFAIALAGAD